MLFRKGPNMKTYKFHCKLHYILKVRQNKHTWNLASKLSKNGVKTKWSKIIEFGAIFGSKMVPWGLPGRSQSLLWPPPGSLKASPGSLCPSCLAPPGTPCEPLAPSRHCLGASKSYLGSLGPKHLVLGVLGPQILSKIKDLPAMLSIPTILIRHHLQQVRLRAEVTSILNWWDGRS